MSQPDQNDVLEMPEWKFAEVTPYERVSFSDFTFPAYQERLFLPAWKGKILALGAWHREVPCGLAAVELKPGGEAKLLSIWLDPAHRKQGAGRALLRFAEDALRQKNFSQCTTTYRTTLPECAAFEALLLRCGWSPPHLRMLVLEANWAGIRESPFMLNPPPLEPEFTIGPWDKVPLAEVEALGKTGQFSVEVWPLNYGGSYHRESSFGVRYRGELVGWVVNHPKSPEVMRYTASYLRDDLQRRGRFAAVLAESVRRAVASGFPKGIWTVPACFPRMLAFARRRLAPYCGRISETRGSERAISPVPYEDGAPESEISGLGLRRGGEVCPPSIGGGRLDAGVNEGHPFPSVFDVGIF